MLRITRSRAAGGEICLRLEGELAGLDLAELSRSAHAGLLEGALILDLGDVSLVSAPGRSLLRSLRDSGALLVDCPPSIAGMLDV